jgi:hypothetical protein
MTEEKMTTELYDYARLLSSSLKEEGIQLRAKLLQYRDIVYVGLSWSKMGFEPSIEVAKEGVREAVLSCAELLYGNPNPLYTGLSIKTMVYPWMQIRV